MRRLWVWLVVVALLGAGCSARATPSPTPAAPAAVPQDLAKVWEAYRILQDRYVDRGSLDKEKLADAALEGLLGALGDRFTQYLGPQEFRSAQERIEGRFQGIGATVTLRDGKPTVVSPLPDTPAERAGLRPGDVILKVDDRSVEGMRLQEIVDLIRGDEGTPVRVQVQREGDGGVLEFRIVRAKITNRTVSFEVLPEKIARVRITEFSSSADEEFRRVLEQLAEQKITGMVLDLRNNPGGLVNTVINVASQLLPDGIVGYQVDSNGKREDWRVRGGGLARELPVVVLVNRGSASGSEVLAGALQDRQRAAVVGTRTFGKGVVNEDFRLRDGSGVKLTVARWYTPNGRQIASQGITPDLVVEGEAGPGIGAEDRQLAEAITALRRAIGALQANAAGSSHGG